MKILEILTEKRKLGNVGERAAARYLKRHGYKILKRNYVAVGFEIDIIAENKTTLAFVEVKSRSDSSLGNSEARPASSVTPDKQRKIITAAKFYIGARKLDKHVSLDVIEVYLTDSRRGKKVREIRHLENTFNKNTANAWYL